MTGFVVDLTQPTKRVLVCSDTLSYTVADQHAPAGFCVKVIAFPHLRGALLGGGIYEIQVRAAAELMLRSDLTTFDRVVAELPAIFRNETERTADERGIENPESLMLFEGVWCGYNEALGKFEMVTFPNYENDYAPKRGFSGLIGMPNVPPSYVPANFNAITSPEVRAMTALRAIRRFSEDHGDKLGMPPIGGEIVLTEITLDGVSSKVVGRFDDYAETTDKIIRTQAEIASGERSYAGFDLVNGTADRPAAMERFETLARQATPAAASPALSFPGGPASLNRQQRRATERKARKVA